MALSEYRGRPWFLVNYRTVIWSGEKNKIKKKKKKNKKKKTSTNLFDRAYGMRDKLFCATFSFALIIFFPLNLRCHFVISIYQYSRNFSSKFSSDFIASIHVSISQHLFLPFAQRREFWNRTSFGATLTLKPYFQPVMTARQAIFNLQDFEIRNALRTVRRFPNILANPNFKKNVHVRSSKNSSEYSQRSIIYPYINRNRANRIIYNPIAITQQFDEKRWS